MEEIIKYVIENYNVGRIDKEFTKKTLTMLVNENKSAKEKQINSEDIAIIGIGLKIAGCTSLEDYWKVIENGIDSIRDFPEDRKKQVDPFVQRRYGKEMRYSKGAYIDNISDFDYKFFRCTPKEASLMDPNQKVFLEVAWNALEDSGHLNDKIKRSNTGVFLGYSPAISESYQEMVNIVNKNDVASSIPFNVSSVTASRLSFLLDLKGPSMVIDSACSSGLVVIDTAMKYLKEHNCDMAVAGAIKLHLLPVDDKDYYMGIESEDGHTRTFDGKSTGAGFGEGATAIVLKRLSDAERDHDHIYAVIKGSAVNQDGKSIGITAPNPKSQKEVILEAWKNAKIDNPETIDYIETHGTGTVLGDPIEIKSIAAAFAEFTDQANFCGISSVKSNIGHLYESAGIASVIKAVLALNHKIIPKTNNYKTVNNAIDYINSPIYINTMNRAWTYKGHPRRCAVSAFGYSGTNGHLVLEEYEGKIEAGQTDNDVKNVEYLIPFSAETLESLRFLIKAYIKNGDKINKYSCKNIGWTLAHGRKHYSYRFVIKACSTSELMEAMKKIEFVLDQEENCSRLFRYHKIIPDKKENRKDYEITELELIRLSEEAEKCIREDHNYYEKLTELYCKGADINWDLLYERFENKIIVSLPGYMFHKTASWVDTSKVLVSKVSDYYILPEVNTEKTEDKVVLKIAGKSEYTPTERKVCEILSDILGFTEIDVYDNFYEMGLDSISMMKIVSAVKERLQVNIKFSVFANNLNVNLFAEIIDNSSKEEKHNQTVNADPAHRYASFGLTNIQRAYVLGRDNYYNLGNTSTHLYMEYETQLDFNRLEVAVNKIIQKHPMLRCIVYADLTQKIMEVAPWYHIKIQDKTHCSRIEETVAMRKEKNRMSHQIFDVGTWPMFEIKGIVTRDKRYIFVSLDLLIADGVSLQLLLRDLHDFYMDDTKEVQSAEYTFRDYIAEYAGIKDYEEYKEAKAYWRSKIDLLPQAPQLPLMKAVEEIVKPHFSRKQVDYGEGSLARMKEVATRHGVTISAILCTAYAMVLKRWSVTNNFTINIASYNRYDFNEQVDELVGDFTSVLLLPVDYENDIQFWDKVKLVQQNIFEAIQNRAYDGVSVIGDILAKSGEYAKALFPVVFTCLITDEDIDMSFFGKEVFGSNQTPQVYLDYQARSQNGRFIVVWDYVDELLDKTMINEMSECHTSILKQILMDTDVVMQDEYYLDAWKDYNETFVGYEMEPIVYTLQRAAKRYADKEAVILGNQSITYHELNKKANRISDYLRRQGIGRGDYVGVITERKIETVINLLGVLKSGAAYVPIDYKYPEERIKYIIENSNCKVVLRCDIILLKGIYSEEDPDVCYNLQDIMYIIYTSGSTGMPKGVVITQEAALNTMIDINERFRISDCDRVIGISSFCFDLSVYDVFGTLMTGATLVMINDQRDISEIIQTVVDKKITVWNSVPAIMNITANTFENKFEALRVVMLSGDWIPVNLPERIRCMAPNAEIYSLGGATEGAIWSIYYPIYEVKSEWTSIPYGMPLANQTMYIINEDMDICPAGVQGEICIGGIGVAKGYCNDEERTSHSFINHPKLGYLYRTGDYGRFDREGYIVFLGRKDFQVKINGYRVELGEIEKCLRKVDGIVDAAVSYDKEAGRKLIAFVTTNKELNEDAIIQEISKYLTTYMIPQKVYIVPELILSANSKVDIKAMMQLNVISDDEENIIDQFEPANESEMIILNIIKQESKNEAVDLNSRLLNIGIDSVVLIGIITKLNKKFGIKLNIEDVFSMKNIKALCNTIADMHTDSNYAAIPKGMNKDYYPTTQMQRDLYLACVNNANRNRSYHIKHAIMVEGCFDIEKCKAIINRLIERHEMLRTEIYEDKGSIIQRIRQNEKYNFVVIEATMKDLDKVIHDNLYEDEFDGRHLFRFFLIRLEEEQNVIVFDVHHIIADGLSLHILMDDFIHMYNEIEPALCQIQFTDYVEWEMKQSHENCISYWKKELSGLLPDMKLPYDYLLNEQKTCEGSFVRFVLQPQIYQKMIEESNKTGYSRFIYLYTAACLLLSQYYRQDDILIGTTSAGRDIADIENTVGMFVNTLPIRIFIDHNEKIDSLMQRVQKKILSGMQNHKFMLSDIIHDIQMKNRMLYDVIFSYQYYDVSSMEVKNVKFTPYPLNYNESMIPLEISILEMSNTIRIELIYSTELFVENTINNMADKYQKMISDLCSHTEDEVSELFIEEDMGEDDLAFTFTF